MSAFTAFFKKEVLENLRNGKLIILGILSFALGIMNPAIAKLTPWLFDLLSEQLAGSGMIVTDVSVNALTAWTQFFKNMPMALIVFVFLYSSTLTGEYETGTLVLILTKGLSRYQVLLAKFGTMLILWSSAYWLCFGITYAYTAYFWDNSIAVGRFSAAIHWWLFGVFVVALMILFSTLSKQYSGVLLGTGGSVLALYLLGFLPKIANYTPTALMHSTALLAGAESADDYRKTIVVTALISIACICTSIPVFNKKQL